jgi:hypothetical protein
MELLGLLMRKRSATMVSIMFCLFLLGAFSSRVFASSVMWSQTFGNVEPAMPYSLVETSDGGFAIAGGQQALGVSYDYWLVKTDANGGIQWSQSYGGNSIEMTKSLVETVDGGYALAGYTESFGAGSSDFWLVKTDSNGIMLWNRTYGGSKSDTAYSLVETSDRGYALAGSTGSFGEGLNDCWLIKIDINGNIEWNQTYGGEANDVAYSLVRASDGGYVIAGTTGSFGTEGFDYWLIKTDSRGNMQWNQTYGGIGNDYAYSLVETFDADYALVGMTESFGAGKADVWLIKTDAHGNMQWNQTFGGAEPDEANSLIQTFDGGYALAGYTTSGDETLEPFHVEDFWLIKTDESGKLEWNQTYGDAWDERAQSLIQTSDGGYALTGYSLSGPPGGDMKFLVIKTNQFGNIPEFPSWMLLLLFVGISIVALISRNHLSKNP